MIREVYIIKLIRSVVGITLSIIKLSLTLIPCLLNSLNELVPASWRPYRCVLQTESLELVVRDFLGDFLPRCGRYVPGTHSLWQSLPVTMTGTTIRGLWLTGPRNPLRDTTSPVSRPLPQDTWDSFVTSSDTDKEGDTWTGTLFVSVSSTTPRGYVWTSRIRSPTEVEGRPDRRTTWDGPLEDLLFRVGTFCLPLSRTLSVLNHLAELRPRCVREVLCRPHVGVKGHVGNDQKEGEDKVKEWENSPVGP